MTKVKQDALAQQINLCKELINESKLNLVEKKILCESSVLEYLEKMIQTEENKLNNKLRHLTKLYQSIVTNNGNNLYKIENEINYLMKTLQIYNKQINGNNSLFSIISVEWIESSISLQSKMRHYQNENKLLKSELEEIKNNKTKIIEKDKDNIKTLQNKYNSLKIENKQLKSSLKDKNDDIQKTLKLRETNLIKLQNVNNYIKSNITDLCTKSMNQLFEIKNLLKSSNPIQINLNLNDTDNTYQRNENEEETEEIEVINEMNNLYKSLVSTIKYNKNFINQQNKFCKDISSESAKLLSSMELQNVENEKQRNEEIKVLIKETRLNLRKEYGEYNKNCDKKVENIKNEYMKYREDIINESKKQIKNKGENFETAKDLMRKRYEDEMLSIKKLYQNKNEKLSNDIQILHKKLINDKIKYEEKLNMKCKEIREEYNKQILLKSNDVNKGLKMIENKYKMKEKELMKQNENRIINEREQFKTQQQLLHKEIENLTKNFENEIQKLKRFKPHHIVHVPVHDKFSINHRNNISTYSSQLQEYISSTND